MANRSGLSEPYDPIPTYSAEEERQDGKLWRTVVIGEQEHRINMKIIEPYMRVISHGGEQKRAIFHHKNRCYGHLECFQSLNSKMGKTLSLSELVICSSELPSAPPCSTANYYYFLLPQVSPLRLEYVFAGRLLGLYAFKEKDHQTLLRAGKTYHRPVKHFIT